MFLFQIRDIKKDLITHFQNFETIEQGNAWVNEVESKQHNPWGKLERVVPYLEATLEELEDALEIIPEVLGENDEVLTHKQVRLPKTYEIIIQDKSAEHQLRNQIELDIAQGELDQKKCSSALKYIGGYNRRNLLTPEEITQMQTTFSQVFTMLIANRPDTAIALIEQIPVDNSLVTNELKTNVIKILSDEY